MTVNNFLEFFNFNNSIQSYEKINYGGTEIPKYALEEVIDEPGNKEYNYYSYNFKTGNYNMRRLYWNEGVFTHYLYHQKRDELQEMLNDGSLYKTIMQQVIDTDKKIDDTVKKLENSNNDIQLAKRNNDIEKYKKLLNNLRLIVREDVYKNMVFV